LAIATNATMVQPSTDGSSRFQWVKAQTLTSSDQTVGLVGFAAVSQAVIYAKSSSVSGTSPTMDIYVQRLLPDTTTWHDIAHFTQFTGNANRVMSMVTGGNKEEAQQAGSLAAATINSVAFGSTWRLSVVIGGTTPSFVLDVYVETQ